MENHEVDDFLKWNTVQSSFNWIVTKFVVCRYLHLSMFYMHYMLIKNVRSLPHRFTKGFQVLYFNLHQINWQWLDGMPLAGFWSYPSGCCSPTISEDEHAYKNIHKRESAKPTVHSGLACKTSFKHNCYQ